MNTITEQRILVIASRKVALEEELTAIKEELAELLPDLENEEDSYTIESDKVTVSKKYKIIKTVDKQKFREHVGEKVFIHTATLTQKAATEVLGKKDTPSFLTSDYSDAPTITVKKKK